jgi:hypothetical protein
MLELLLPTATAVVSYLIFSELYRNRDQRQAQRVRVRANGRNEIKRPVLRRPIIED